MEKFIQGVDKAEALIGREVIRRYGGFYGPTCVVDFALVPGGTTNLVNRILTPLDIEMITRRPSLPQNPGA